MKQFFKFHRRSVSERGMQTLAVVHFLDEKGKPNLNVFQSPVFPEIDFLDLDSFEIALGGGIIVRIPFPGHADPEAMHEKHLDIVVGGILDAPYNLAFEFYGELQ